MGNIEYDVFISKNSEDQDLANSLVSFLESKGLCVFESSRSLPKLGLSDYQRVIFEALDKSASVLVICSENENGNTSGWVRGEWSWFLNENLSGRRTGQIMTVRKGIEIKDIDIQLRMYESFDFDKDLSRMVEYVKPKAVRHDDPQLCELHFGTDLPCEVFQFGKQVGHVDPDGDFFLKLRPGKYKFKFVCSSSKEKSCSVVHIVPEAGSDYLEVELKKTGVSVEYTNAEKEGLSMKHDVFLVYSRRNLDKARLIYGQLKVHGISCWLDTDGFCIRGSFQEVLMDTIKASKTVVFLSSQESNASRFVIDEICLAVKYGKKVIPVLLDDAPFAREIDYVLPGVDCLSFHEDYIQKLLMRIQLAQ